MEEQRTRAHLWMLAYKNIVARLYNQKDKLSSNWEESYQIIEVVRDGTYHLATTEGRQLPRT
ncbi:hypothetical protein BHE74_00053263 [Ensete ventricosum]|nr:hypothetical protein BHE74_00053263 [Ensete ventricosum]RZR93877.1 hypothetical protein BHM03_00022455 [Ensete ventricosum]